MKRSPRIAVVGLGGVFPGSHDLEGFWRLLEAIPNNRRKVPVPRTAIQLLAGGARRGVIVTVLPDNGFKYLSDPFWD